MNPPLYNYFSAAIILLSIFAIMEVSVYFKRPIILKVMFLVLLSSIFFANIFLIYCSYNGYNRWLIELPKTIIMITIFNIMGYLYFHQIKRFIILICIILFLLNVTSLVFFESLSKFYYSKPFSYENPISIFAAFVKILLISTILFFIIKFYIKFIRLNSTENFFHTQLKSWIKKAILVILFIALNFYFIVLFLPKFELIRSLSIINQIFLCGLILFRPRFLNRTNLKLSLRGTFATHSQKNFEKETFFIQFFNNYYFLEPDSNLENFAQKLNITTEVLNEFILEQYSLNFTDLINKSRIDYFVELAKSGDFANWTIIALAEKAGFGSRPSLNRAFRRFHGGTPSDFLKSLG